MFVRMLYFDPGFMGWVFKFIVLFVAFSKNISPSAERGMKTEERKEGRKEGEDPTMLTLIRGGRRRASAAASS